MERIYYYTIFLYVAVQIATAASDHSPTSSTNFSTTLTATSTINPTTVTSALLITTSENDASYKSASMTSLPSIEISSTQVVYSSNATVTNILKPSSTLPSTLTVTNTASISQTLSNHSASISLTHSLTSSPINTPSQSVSSALVSSTKNPLPTESSLPSTGSSMTVSKTIIVATSSISISQSAAISALSSTVTSTSSAVTVTSSIEPTLSSTVSPTPSSTVSTPSDNHSKSKKTSGLSGGSKAAIGIFVTILVIAVIVGLLWMRKRKWFRDGTSISSSIQYKPWKYTDEASVNINR